MKISRHLYVHWTVPFIFFFSVPLKFFVPLVTVYLIAIMHELAHVITAGLFGIKLKRIEMLPFGVTMLLDASYIKIPRQEIIIALMGPVTNIIIAAAYYMLADRNLVSVDFGKFVIIASLMMASINLVPALPLDGGRMLKAYLTIEWGFVKAFNFTMLVTKVVAALLALAGIIILAYTKLNFSVLLIAAFLIVNIVAEKRSGTMMIMRDVIYSREKLTDGFSKGSTIVAMYDKPARCLLKKFDYHRYYMVDVVDKDSKYIATLSETQIIDGIIDKGSRVKLIELL